MTADTRKPQFWAILYHAGAPRDARSGCSRSTYIAPALRPRAERLPARRGQRDQVDHEARSCSSLLGWLQMAYGNITDNETLLVDDFLHRCIHLVLNGR